MTTKAWAPDGTRRPHEGNIQPESRALYVLQLQPKHLRLAWWKMLMFLDVPSNSRFLDSKIQIPYKDRGPFGQLLARSAVRSIVARSCCRSRRSSETTNTTVPRERVFITLTRPCPKTSYTPVRFRSSLTDHGVDTRNGLVLIPM